MELDSGSDIVNKKSRCTPSIFITQRFLTSCNYESVIKVVVSISLSSYIGFFAQNQYCKQVSLYSVTIIVYAISRFYMHPNIQDCQTGAIIFWPVEDKYTTALSVVTTNLTNSRTQITKKMINYKTLRDKIKVDWKRKEDTRCILKLI